MRQPSYLAWSGRWSFRVRLFAMLLWSTVAVTARRLVRGPHLPGWTWALEVGTHFVRRQGEIAASMPQIAVAREWTDALVLMIRTSGIVTTTVSDPITGRWHIPTGASDDLVVLYLHGGGYAFASKAHEGFASVLATSLQTRLFALDYRLSPEHTYPAALEDAIAAYQWLIAQGSRPEHVVIMGDSAGGNLVLATSLALRDRGITPPKLAICLCPWTDLTNPGNSMMANAPHDWVHKGMADQWATWYRGEIDARDPRISPTYADLHGLLPIYMQAGRAEILYDMIQDFVARALEQGCDLTLDVWDDMNHDFQAYGNTLPQSRQALARIVTMIDTHIPRERS